MSLTTAKPLEAWGKKCLVGREGKLKRLEKTGSVGAEVTSYGRLFQSRLPATGKARSPMVTSRVGLDSLG